MSIKKIMCLLLTAPFSFLKDKPVLYKGRDFQIVNFGIFAAVNIYIVLTLMFFYLSAKGYTALPFYKLYLAIPLIAVFIWVFARVVNLLTVGGDLFVNPRKYLLSTGFNVHGGIMGVFCWLFGFSIYLDLPFSLVLDSASYGVLLGQAIGRLGCYNYGCCYGKPSAQGCGITYHNELTKALRVNPSLKGVALYPTQIITAVAHVIVFLLLTLVLVPRGQPDGLVIIIFLVYHGASRLLIERLRGDLFIDFDPNQKKIVATSRISIFMICAGLCYLPFVIYNNSVTAFTSEYSFSALLGFVAANPRIMLLLLPVALFIFAGFGLHGRVLGTFPLFQEK